jgi:hypothetical protein
MKSSKKWPAFVNVFLLQHISEFFLFAVPVFFQGSTVCIPNDETRRWLSLADIAPSLRLRTFLSLATK